MAVYIWHDWGLLFNKLVDLWLIKLVAVLIYACLRAHAQWLPQWVIATVAARPSEWISWLMITKLGCCCRSVRFMCVCVYVWVCVCMQYMPEFQLRIKNCVTPWLSVVHHDWQPAHQLFVSSREARGPASHRIASRAQFTWLGAFQVLTTHNRGPFRACLSQMAISLITASS